MAQLTAYLPRPLAAWLLDHPQANPVGAEQRFEAIGLFADISGFTSLSEELTRFGPAGAEALTVLLSRYFATVIELIETYGGMVSTFGGDSIAALVRNSAEERAAAAWRAITCACARQAAMADYRSIATQAGTFQLGLKIGLGRSAPQPEWAARLCGFVDAILAATASVLERAVYDKALAAARGGLAAAFDIAWEAGRRLRLAQIDLAAAGAFAAAPEEPS